MEFDESQAQTPHSGKKKGASKAAASFKKMITRRLSKSISSERGGSISSSENVPTEEASNKRFSSLTRRLGRGRNKSDVARGAVTEREIRRSFSVDDVTNIPDEAAREGKVDSPVLPLEKGVNVPDFDEASQFVQTIFPTSDGLVPPDTPVPEQRLSHGAAAVDTRSSSSANVSANEEVHELEPKVAEMPVDDVTDRVDDAILHAKESEIEEKVKEIDALRGASFDFPTDADATIDAQIERTVMESLVGGETAVKEVTVSEDAKEITAEKEIEPEEELKQTVEKAAEAKIEKTQLEPTEVVEAVAVETKEEEDAVEAFMEAKEETNIAQVKSRDMDITDLVAREGEQDSAIEEAEETALSDTFAIKPKRRRGHKIFRRASISLASLAVGLLLVIIKNKH